MKTFKVFGIFIPQYRTSIKLHVNSITITSTKSLWGRRLHDQVDLITVVLYIPIVNTQGLIYLVMVSFQVYGRLPNDSAECFNPFRPWILGNHRKFYLVRDLEWYSHLRYLVSQFGKSFSMENYRDVSETNTVDFISFCLLHVKIHKENILQEIELSTTLKIKNKRFKQWSRF